uniref:S-layer domain-containing protein n=1 Tax=Geobacillus sp. (strain Y4.1MC1) TaxID=581103 RepID=A0A7U3YCB6_GEOS0
MAYQPKSYRKFLAGSVSAALVATAVGPVVANAASFSDVNPNDSHAANINALVELGYIKGFTDGTFKPYQSITRGQVAKIFARILTDQGFQAPDKIEQVFDDVPLDAKDQELVKAAAIVKAAGVMTGSQGKLNPAQNITREQMAKVLVEAFDLTKPADFTSKITDLDKADPSFRDYIQTLEANGVTVVTEYRPKDSVTRAAFASFVKRALDVSSVVTADDITEVKFVDENTLEVTFNGELKEVKKEDFAIEGVEIDSVSIKAAASAEGKTTVVVIKTKTKLEEGKTYTISYKGKTTDKAKVEVPVVTPKVESVSAINAKQIEIKFNTKMDKDSVTDVTKYSIKRAGVPAVKLSDVSSANEYATAELSEDGKTLTITFKNALTTPAWGSIAEGDTFNFETAKLKAANGKEIDAASYAVKYSDKVAPVFVSAKAVAKTTTNKITLTFSEPIDYSVATVSVDGVFGSLSAGSKPNELVVTTNANLEVGKTYNLQILNVKDVAGNLLTPNPVNTTVTVTSDTAAPVVTDVKVVRDNLIEVTFDKSMDASTLTANGTVKLMDANFSNTNAISSVTPKDNTDNKVFLVALNPVSFNDNGNFLGTLVISDSAKDSLGNAIATTTKAVSLVKDTVKPQAISVKYVKATTYGDQTGLTNGALVVKFSEEIQTSTGSIVVVDDQGQTISVGSPVVNGKDKTELIIPLTAPVAQTAKFYTVSVSAGTVKDLSSQQNSNALATLTADVSAGAVTGKDTAAPSITSISGVAAVKATSTGNQITFTIQDQANAGETASGVDFTTVTDVNNYRLDGAPLPSGSYVKVTGSDPSYTVTIQLPFGAISKDKNYSLNINGIKDKAGNVITPVAVNNVELKDDVQPELKTATLNANGTVSLGFSEDVVPVATASSAVLDFTVELNGSTLTKPAASPATDLAYELIDGTGADAGKYVLRVKVSKETQTVTDAATGITINGVKYTVDNDGDNLLFKFIDVNGNKTADNGDIILSATDVDSTTQSFDFDSYYDLTKATSLKVGTVATPTVVTDTSTLANELVGNKKITVK